MRHETLRLWRPCGRAIGLAAISTCLNVSCPPGRSRVSGLMSARRFPHRQRQARARGGNGRFSPRTSPVACRTSLSPKRKDVARPPRPCIPAGSKGEGALATSRGRSRPCHIPQGVPAIKKTFSRKTLAPLRSPLAFATLATVSSGPGLPKRRGQPPFPFGLKGKTNEKANVCNGPRGVRCGLR